MDPIAAGLPHREPFVFVDEITAVEAGGPAVGAKTFDGSEPFFAGHFPGNPIVPGVILTEALAQVAGIAGAAGEPGAMFLLSAVRAMKFSRAVRPGERIELTATPCGGMGELAMFDTTARVDGEVVVEGRIVLSRTT